MANTQSVSTALLGITRSYTFITNRGLMTPIRLMTTLGEGHMPINRHVVEQDVPEPALPLEEPDAGRPLVQPASRVAKMAYPVYSSASI